MIHSCKSLQTHQRNRSSGIAIGQFDSKGHFLTSEQVLDNYRKKGLCQTCGVTKTHKKKTSMKSGFYMEALTKDGVVYRGWCLKCHNIEEILERPDVKEQLEKKSIREKSGHHRRQILINASSLRHRAMKIKIRGHSCGDDEPSVGAIEGSPMSLKTVATEDSTDEIDEYRDMDTIITEMMEQPDSSSVQVRGCADLADFSDESLDTISRAIDTIVAAMTNHIQNLDVQKKGCRAFLKFTAKGKLSSRQIVEINAENVSKIVVQGGIFAIVSSMRAHEESGSLQREGMRVLRNILCANTKNRQLCVMSDSEISAVINAMKVHMNSGSVQKIACRLLETTARSSSNLKSIQENVELRSLIVEAANNFPELCSNSVTFILSIIDGSNINESINK